MKAIKKTNNIEFKQLANEIDNIRCHQPHDSGGLFYSLDNNQKLQSIGFAEYTNTGSEQRYQFTSVLTINTPNQATFQQSRTCSIFFKDKKEIHHHSAYSESAYIEKCHGNLDLWIKEHTEHLVQRAQK